MELVDALIKTPIAEKSGATTAARLRYQQHWALSEILKRYLAGEDCLFIFEYHDDVIVLTPATSPQTIEFFQVKTKNGLSWTLTELLKQKEGIKGKSLSTVGKLYSHLVHFLDHTKRLYFVTNTHFNFIKDKDVIETVASTLDEKDRQKIVSRMSDELPTLGTVPLDVLCFARSVLSLEGQEAHVKGIITEFLIKKCGKSSASSIEAWYHSLMGEVSKKNNATPSHIATMDQLTTIKGFSSTDLQEYLNQVKAAEMQSAAWSDLRQYLINEGIKPIELVQLGHEWAQLHIDLLNPTNAGLSKLLADARDATNPHLHEAKVTETMNKSYDAMSVAYSGASIPFSESYIKAAILWVYSAKKG